MLKTTMRTTRIKLWVLQAARDPRNLTSTENKRIDGCRSWKDASNASFRSSRAV